MAKIEGQYLLVTVFQIDLTQLDKPGALHELGHFGMAGEVSDFVKY
jgi:hypothetical protein